MPLSFPETGYPAPQGPYYCSVGASVAFGRAIAEEHMKACIHAGLAFHGINAEVMPGQWEFQIGYRGFGHESADPLTMSDHLWFGRLLQRAIAEKYAARPIAAVRSVFRAMWPRRAMVTSRIAAPVRMRTPMKLPSPSCALFAALTRRKPGGEKPWMYKNQKSAQAAAALEPKCP
jgi:hypothetical protein